MPSNGYMLGTTGRCSELLLSLMQVFRAVRSNNSSLFGHPSLPLLHPPSSCPGCENTTYKRELRLL